VLLIEIGTQPRQELFSGRSSVSACVRAIIGLGKDVMGSDSDPDDVSNLRTHLGCVAKDRSAVRRPGHLVVTWHSFDAFHPQPGTEPSMAHVINELLERLTKGALLLSVSAS
jgi:hypothetical protein